MRKKRSVLWIGLLVFLAITGAVALYKPLRDGAFIMGLIVYYDMTKPNDPLTRRIRDGGEAWGEPVALTPEPLKVGMTQTEVEALLREGKFNPDESRDFSWHRPKTFPDDSLFYSKTVEGVPCTLGYVVVVRYNDRRTLVAAVGTENGGACL